MTARRLARGLALLILFIPSAAWCLGLGDIKVDTALNQPLRGEIRLLSVQPDELDNMRVSLASQETFDRIGIERPLVLSQLEFKPIQTADGRSAIAVSTKQPVREPFLNFLVEVQWPNGRLLREYTVLLDPPVLMNRRDSLAAATPAVVSQAARTPEQIAASEPAATAERRQDGQVSDARAAKKSARANKAAASAYSGEVTFDSVDHEVKSGETLGEIAQRYRTADDVSLSRMMIAILRANPDAFADGNINNLMSGVILRMPAGTDVVSIGEEEAVAEVARQNDLWREYRAQVADAVPAQQIDEAVAAAEPVDGAEQNVANGEGARTQDSAAQNSSDEGRLKIMASNQGNADVQAGNEGDAQQVSAQSEEARAQDLLAQELAQARQVQIDSLQSKVSELESMIAKQERIIKLQSEALAGLQARLQDDSAATQTEPVAEAEGIAAADDVAAAGEESENSTVVADAASGNTAEAKTNFVETNADAVQAVQELAGSVNDAPTPAGVDQAETLQARSEPAPVASPLDAVETTIQATQSELAAPALNLMDELLSSPAMLGGIGVGAALLLGLIWLVVRRAASRKVETIDLDTYKGEREDDAAVRTVTANAQDQESASPQVSDVQGNGAATENVSVTGGAPAVQKAAAEPQSSPVNDDTLAEADVYIAYGLHQQAEDLLQDALRRSRGREDYRLKLLDVYYATRNHAGFDAQARQLLESSGGKPSANWDRVVIMGREISPDNPLYGVEAAVPGTVAAGMTDSATGQPDVVAFAAQRDESSRFAAAGPRPGDDVGRANLETGEKVADANGSAAADETRILNFDATDLDATVMVTRTSDPQASAQTEDTGLDFDLSDLELIDAGGGSDPAAKTALGPAPEMGTQDPDFPDNVRAFSAQRARPADVTQVNSDSSLDFSLEDTQQTALLDEDLLKLADASGTDSLETLSGDDEVGTKLDLARAYMDMGDADGALSTLQEVLQEGDDNQRKEAEVLMRQIA